MAIQKPNPIPLAMLLCDSVIEDKGSGKKSLIGLFNSISAAKAPCTHGPLDVFLSLTEGNGEYEVVLRLVRSDTEAVIIELPGKIKFLNPQGVLEIHYHIGSVTVPEFGDYRFDFYCGQNLVISRRFRVAQS